MMNNKVEIDVDVDVAAAKDRNDNGSYKANGTNDNDGGGDDENDGDAIPVIVQRALGMQNLKPPLQKCHDATRVGGGLSSSSPLGNYGNDGDDNDCHSGDGGTDGVIRGLEGFLLPRYLTLRTSSNPNSFNKLTPNNRDNASNRRYSSVLPEPLLRAQTEERLFRGHNRGRMKAPSHQNAKRGERSNNKKRKQRKRKRKSDHQHTNPHGGGGDSLDKEEGSNGGSTNTDADGVPVAVSNCQKEGDMMCDKIDDDGMLETNNEIDGQKRRRCRKRRRRQKCISSSSGRLGGAADTDTVNNNVANNGNNACNNKGVDDDSWLHHQMMARMIVAPFTSTLIATLNRCKQVEKQKLRVASQESSTSGDGDGSSRIDVGSTTTTAAKIAAQAQKAAQTLSVAEQDDGTIAPGNIYQRKKNRANTESVPSLSPPQESLETIVDGAVDTLVRRTHRYRSLRSSQQSSSSSTAVFVKKGSRRENKIIYRRRKRRYGVQQKNNLNSQGQQHDRTKATKQECGCISQSINSNSSNNNWLLEQNLLSKGYHLGSGDTISNNNNHGNSFSSNNNNHNQTIQLQGCPNMAPGIHCLHPNPLASYARSSALMRRLHALVGDDVLREILIGCVVLVPALLSSSTAASSLATASSGAGVSDKDVYSELLSSLRMFERGNYFQLCGPPLNVLAKKFDGMCDRSDGKERLLSGHAAKKKDRVGNDIQRCQKQKRLIHVTPATTTAGCTGSSDKSNGEPLPSKQKGRDDESKLHKKSKKLKTQSTERWHPNKPIPRGNLFYCDFYNQHVGLSPHHLLNQWDTKEERLSVVRDDESPQEQQLISNNANDVNVKLLNSMVRIWPVSGDEKQPRESGTNVVNSNKRRGRWRRLRESGIAMCQEMRRRHKQCNYGRLLERHCPLPGNNSTTAETKTMDAKTTLSQYVTLHHTPVENVGSFLEAVLRSAFPNSFWGSMHNFTQVVKTMRVFTKLGRNEQLPEKAIVEGIRVLDMTWQHPRKGGSLRRCTKAKTTSPHAQQRHSSKLSRSDHESTTTLVCNVMRWLYRKFIIPLLRSTFYITETEFTGSRVLYYRRPTWMRIKFWSMKILLQRGQYREINAAKAQKLLSNHNVGCPPAPLRLLPKKTGIRAIAMLSKSCDIRDAVDAINRDESVESSAAASMKPQVDAVPPNMVLQSTLHALKYEHEKKPSLFGAGVLGLTDVFPAFCLFVGAMKHRWSNPRSNSSSGSSDNSGQNPLYFASADIKHCYDTINQKRLYKLMRSVVEEDVYLTKNNFILHTKDNNSSARCRWKKHTFSPEKFSLSPTDAHVEKYFQSIFVDGVHCSMEKKDTINGILRDHIFGQVVVAQGSHDERYLLQKDGIPQGSILSSMFCNIYFGDLERFMLNNHVFEKESECVIRGSSLGDCNVLLVRGKGDVHLLVRIVDDFLLVSTSKLTSVRFLERLNKGIPGLGVKINSDKSRVNYSLSLENAATGKLEPVTICSDFFPWCGLLLDTHTCEISLDHKRFSESQATDTVVIQRAGQEGLHLKKKMKDFVRPRCCQKLLFSSCINGIDTIRLNFFQTFVLCAIKLKHYLNGSGITSLRNHQYVYDSACDTIKFAFLLISSKIRHGNVLTNSPQNKTSMTSFQLTWEDALWLGRHAFFSVFQNSRSDHTRLCSLFSGSVRSKNRNELLAVSRRALKSFPL